MAAKAKYSIRKGINEYRGWYDVLETRPSNRDGFGGDTIVVAMLKGKSAASKRVATLRAKQAKKK